MILQLFKNKNISNNLISLSGNVVQAGLGFITFLVLVRYTDKIVFGKWIIFITIATLMDMFRLGLTGMATIRLLSLKKTLNKVAIGSSYQLSLITSAITAVVFWLVYFVLKLYQPENEYAFIFLFYPILAVSNLPFYQANIVFQGLSNFTKLSVLKLINASVILLFIVICSFNYATIELYTVIWIYIIANLSTSIIVVFKKWDGFAYVKQAKKSIKNEILHFGKYSTASYIGSNLLKSSDTLIIGLVPFLGAEAVAIYAIPFKFVEMIEVILRSFTSTAFPKFTQTLSSNSSRFYHYLINYVGITTILFIPVVVLLLLFPEFFLNIMGGENYLGEMQVQKNMMYIICAYILLLPADRFTGVALFAMNKAKLNFYKILLMLILNLVFDIIAVFVFKSLLLVVLASFLFTLIGMLAGWNFVRITAANEYEIKSCFKLYLITNFELIKKWVQLRTHTILPDQQKHL